MSDGKKPHITFILPLASPASESVRNYDVIEALLKNTTESLLKQTHSDLSVIVCGHKIPDWADGIDDRVLFLNVAPHAPTPPPGPEGFRLDKGRKYILASLHAAARFAPFLIMPGDADDLVHVDLAKRLCAHAVTGTRTDGFVIERGVTALIKVDDDNRFKYQFALNVEVFNRICGHSRILFADRLLLRIRNEFPETSKALEDWDDQTEGRILDVPEYVVKTLVDETDRYAHDDGSIVQLLGRHLRQKPHFRFEPIDWVAAAKTCGHTNHTGKSSGDIPWHLVKHPMPLEQFRADFGLPPEAVVRHSSLALAWSKLTDPGAFTSWAKRTKLAEQARKLIRRFR